MIENTSKDLVKVIAIGDTHGRDTWKAILKSELENLDLNKDKIVFIGDYLDSHDKRLNGLTQTRNFRDIVHIKEAYPEATTLLTGNHEFHYLRVCRSTYSGFQPVYSEGFRDILEHEIKIRNLQVCYNIGDVIFSHAGISTIWCERVGIDINNPDMTAERLCSEINDLFYYTPKVFDFTIGPNFSDCGDDVTQTPIWIRPHSLFQSAPLEWNQVVGHTPQKKMNRQLLMEDPKSNKSHELIFIDTIHSFPGKSKSEYLYLEIENGKLVRTEYRDVI